MLAFPDRITNMADEEVLNKKGIELFKELLRVYSVAEVEDYYKMGVWRDELMKAYLQLIEAHRKEAGAPDPIPLEEVVMPELPKAPVVQPGLTGLFAVRPGMPQIIAAGAVRPMGVTVAPSAALAVATRPVAAPVVAAAASASGPVAELRLIALFVAKWKLDPTRTKMMLAKMTPARRRYVIQNFKTVATGVEATNSLEQFIAQCEKTNAWGAATAPAPAVVPAVTVRPITVAAAPAAVAGIKRPITPVNIALDPSKRIAVAQPRGPTPVQVRPAVWTAAGGAGTIRPVVPKAKAQEKPGDLIRNLLQRF